MFGGRNFLLGWVCELGFVAGQKDPSAQAPPPSPALPKGPGNEVIGSWKAEAGFFRGERGEGGVGWWFVGARTLRIWWVWVWVWLCMYVAVWVRVCVCVCMNKLYVNVYMFVHEYLRIYEYVVENR